MFRLSLFKLVKHQINSIFKVLIIFPCFGCVDHLQQSNDIFLFLRCFIPDVTDQCLIVQFFCFHPEIFPRFIAIVE